MKFHASPSRLLDAVLQVSRKLLGRAAEGLLPRLLAVTVVVAFAGTAQGALTVTFNSGTSVGIKSAGYHASGALSVTLGFKPTAGTNLRVVDNTALPFVSGTFDGIPQGGTVNLSYSGTTYPFIANYYGGNGNDFVLQWPYKRLVAWGDDSYGQVTIPKDLSGVVAIAVGGMHSLALKSDGTVVAWGSSNFFQSNVPEGLGEVVAIAAGGEHSLALKQDGTVEGWGNSRYNQETVPETLSGVVAIAAGSDHSLALKSDGTVVAWGSDGDGQVAVPKGLRDVIAIAARSFGSIAVKKDGTVVAWGLGAYVPDGLSGVVAIVEGACHSLALKSDGTVFAWGDNDRGQTTIPDGLAGVVAVAVGNVNSMALRNDGLVEAWGADLEGQKTILAGIKGVTAIAAGSSLAMALADYTYEPPTVVSSNPSNIGTLTAVLNATVNPRGSAASAYVEYGTTTAFESGITEALALGSGTSNVSFSEFIVNLQENTTYNCRVVVKGLSGELIYGENQTFTTKGAISSLSVTLASGTSVGLDTGLLPDVEVRGILDVTLGFAREVGTSLTVIKNGGVSFISGTFEGIPQGGTVNLPYNGKTYPFIANYYGGTGNDFVLLYPYARVFSWGANQGQDGEDDPLLVGLNGVLSIAQGDSHTLALKSDGTVLA